MAAFTLAMPRASTLASAAMPRAARAAARPLSFRAATPGVALSRRSCALPARRVLAVRAKKAKKEEDEMVEAEIVPPPAETPKVEAPTASASSGNIEVMPGDYRIGGVLLTVAAFLGPVCHLWWPQFFLHAVLGGFLTFQASRVRFRFSDTDLDVVFVEPGSTDETAALAAGTDSSGDNKLQGGGENKWAFSSVTNWEFWWPGFPVLVYYKENQTKANGQPHFFPIIMDGKKLYETMLKKMPPSKNEKVPLSEWNLLTAFQATPVGRRILEELDDEQKATLKSTDKFPIVDK